MYLSWHFAVFFLAVFTASAASETCSGTCTSSQRYTASCGNFGWSRCIRYRLSQASCSCTYSWVAVDACSKSCGRGYLREKLTISTCVSSSRPTSCATKYRTVSCNTQACPVNGVWTGFGAWTNTGACSKTCGVGSQRQVQTRTCTNPRPAHGGTGCVGANSQTKNVQCNLRACPVNGGWTSYSSWTNSGTCSKSCGTGSQRQVQTRTCSSPAPAHGGSDCVGSNSRTRSIDCNTLLCPVNGGWTSYSAWTNSGTCSKSCGTGSQRQVQTRTCSSPAPAHGGSDCVGSNNQTRSIDCNTLLCPVNGAWTEFGTWEDSGTCSVSCGTGSQPQIRHRSCTNPTPAHGGTECDGEDNEMGNVECNTQPCPVNGGWTSYSAWTNSGTCSKSCGTGSQRQVQTRTCSSPAPAHGGSDCVGSNSRTRSIDCNTLLCPVNGAWTEFGTWEDSGTCSVSCGTGSKPQIRNRSCTNPEPAHGGTECDGEDNETGNVECNTQPCPVNGGWSDWGVWGDVTDCSVTCGGGEGIITRQRSCTNPIPMFDGDDCDGSSIETESSACAPEPCPIDGGWSDYTKWSYIGDCSVTCGTGTQNKLRTRVCNNPEPQYDGAQCAGANNETGVVECPRDPCAVDGQWGDWSNWTMEGKCTKTCGSGELIYRRTRSCDNPAPAFGGSKCGGKYSQQTSEVCATDPCPINGGWSEWQDWAAVGECSVTCGTGNRNESRSRDCNNPEPQYDGDICWGYDIESREVECTNTPCPVNGAWSSWTDWETAGLCSVTCGTGELGEKRTRTCTNPQPSYGGNDCLGDIQENRTGVCAKSACPGICDVDGYKFPYDHDFTKYFTCQDGQATLTDCAYSKRWDDVTKTCVAICKSFSSGKLSYPNDCSRYIQCVWGFSIVSHCPLGTAYAAATQQCLHEADVTC